MEESITMPVIVEDKDEESSLSFNYDEDIITLRLDGKEICRFDWEFNLQPSIKRMLEIWEVNNSQ